MHINCHFRKTKEDKCQRWYSWTSVTFHFSGQVALCNVLSRMHSLKELKPVFVQSNTPIWVHFTLHLQQSYQLHQGPNTIDTNQEGKCVVYFTVSWNNQEQVACSRVWRSVSAGLWRESIPKDKHRFTHVARTRGRSNIQDCLRKLEYCDKVLYFL